MIRLFTWVVLVSMALAGPARADAPHGCTLSAGPYSNRMSEVEELLAGTTETRELEDGYEFRFPGTSKWSARLLELIHSERECCGFLRFELAFEPEQGPIWFRVRGSAQVKALLESMME
ncbi:MAG: hypothetical protein GY716_08715 [bacterium]|nr:hypothetical protein [bacterium]